MPFQELSTEYAFIQAAQRKPVFAPNDGVTMQNMLDAIREDGQPWNPSGPTWTNCRQSLGLCAASDDWSGIRRSGSVEHALNKAVKCLEQDQPVVLAIEISIEFLCSIHGHSRASSS
jgi:hypothetical protein